MIFSWRSDSIRRGSRGIIIIQFTSQVHVNIIEVETAHVIQTILTI